jgi:hypothetical protein
VLGTFLALLASGASVVGERAMERGKQQLQRRHGQ